MPKKRRINCTLTLGKGCIVQDDVIIGHSEKNDVIIGNNALISSGTIIYSKVKIGNNFRTGHRAFIRENSEIGDNVLIGTNTGFDGNYKVGSNVNIQTGAYITAFTIAEDSVFIGHWLVTANDQYMVAGAKIVGPTIKNGAGMRANSTILPDVVMGEGASVQ